MVNTIITTASVLTAISVIIASLVTSYKFIRRVDRKIESFSKNQDEIQLNVLRLTVINEQMPLDERVDAGEKYVSRGGNGSIHVLYDVLKEEYETQLKGGKKI